MTITAAMVKTLRERTGAGMMDCKKALTASGGDVEKAIVDMRKAGQLKAAKRAGKTTAEGVVVAKSSDDNRSAVLIEINCETDFVAKDEHMIAFSQQLVSRALAESVGSAEELLSLPYEVGGDATIEKARETLVTKIGENIQVRRLTRLTAAGVVGVYLHGSKIGALVALDSDHPDLAKDLAMHVAATNPQAISEEQVSTALIDAEREIFSAQAAESGKPADIVEKMVAGRIKKFLKEVSLLDQPFVKDPSQAISALLQAAGAKVTAFARYEVGEGIQKEETDFASEVMAQVEGK